MSTVYHVIQLPLFVFSKVCPTCKPPIEKPIDDFPRSSNKYRKDGHALYCKECCRASCKANYAAHREERKKRTSANYYANVEFKRAQSREYNATHKEQIRLAQQAWEKANAVSRCEYMRRRHALKNILTVGDVSYERILERDGFWCYICEKDILPEQKLDFDHVFPLARYGPHCEENIKPTHAICNRRKNRRLLEEMTLFQRRGV